MFNITQRHSDGDGRAQPDAKPPPPAAGQAGWRARMAAAQVQEALRVLAGTPRVLRLVCQAHSGYTALLVVINAAQGLVPLAQIWITKLIIDAVVAAVRADATAGAATFEAAAEVAPSVLALIALQGLVALASQELDPAARLVQQELGDYLTRDLNLRVLRKTNSLVDISFFETPRFYDRLHRAQSEAGFRPLGVLQQLGYLLRGVINLASMFAVLVAFQPLLALAIVVLALPHVVIQFRHQRQTWGLHSHEVPEVRLMNYFRGLLANKDSAKEIRLFGLGEFFLGRYLEKFLEYRRRHRRLRFAQWRWNTALAAIASAGSTGAYVVLEALAGRVTLGSLTFYASAVNQVQGGLSAMIWQVAALYESNLFVSHLFDYLEMAPAMPLSPPDRARTVPAPLRQGIDFRNVAFRYPDSEKPVLEDVSFTIRPGQTVALVGANGAGKTTLVKLLTRLYDPTEGQVLVDGVDLRAYDLEAWRRRIGVIFQDFARYHLVARENIGVGRLEQIEDLAAVRVAAARGGADKVVARLSDGYETTLGRQYWSMASPYRSARIDVGTELSGGEWQKIALSRAFMRSGDGRDGGEIGVGDASAGTTSAPGGEGAQLLILDEPTATLDAEAEYQVYLGFHELTEGKATLLISHRFSTVRMADHIVVLEGGRVSEQGSHEALVALGGTYARLYNRQAERYR